MSETRIVHVKDKVEGAIYIGRVMPRFGLTGSLLANPFRIGRGSSRAEVLLRYNDWLLESSGLWRLIPPLRGRPLACWCRHDGEEKTPENACHGDVLIEWLGRYEDDNLLRFGS